MGVETIALLGSLAIGGGSAIYGGMQQDRAARNHQSRLNRMTGMGTGMMVNGPSEYERLLEGFLANSSQDGMMQAFRRSPEGQANQDALNTLLGISEDGDPFDTSAMFGALDPIDARERSESVSTLRGGASGLGQRFGSAAQSAEADLLAQLDQNQAARRAQIQMGSYESAQGRRMGALEAILQRATQSQGMELGAGQLELAGLQTLLGAESGRRGHNASILGMLMGVPTIPQGQGLAGAGSEISQMAMMLPLMMQLLGIGGSSSTQSTMTGSQFMTGGYGG